MCVWAGWGWGAGCCMLVVLLRHPAQASTLGPAMTCCAPLVLQVGGPGGCLRVCVLGARNLLPPPGGSRSAALPSAAAATASAAEQGRPHGASAVGGAGPATSAAAAAAAEAAGSAKRGDCDPFIELRFGREVFRTPIAHSTADPVWNWLFDVRLPADLGSGLLPSEVRVLRSQGRGHAQGRGSVCTPACVSVCAWVHACVCARVRALVCVSVCVCASYVRNHRTTSSRAPSRSPFGSLPPAPP